MGCGSSKPKKDGATARRGSKHGSDDLCVSAADDEYYSARMLLAATGIAPLSAAGVHASVAGYGVHGEREAARGKALRHVFPLWGGSGSVDAAKHTPLCVQSWCALGVDAPISAADKAQLPQAVAWLSFALRTAYLDLRIRDASRAALEGHAFACSLPHARQWAPLKESLREHLHALSLELQEDDNFNRVGVQLSDEVVAPMCRYHRDFVPGEPASQAGVLPRIPGEPTGVGRWRQPQPQPQPQPALRRGCVRTCARAYIHTRRGFVRARVFVCSCVCVCTQGSLTLPRAART